MPVQVTYPGVYIEELPSGSKTVSGVATSITAFLGRTQRGPIDKDGPMTIFGFDEFVATFGPLHHDYPLGYAVQDFFMNGGSQAIIVRLFKEKALMKVKDDEGNDVLYRRDGKAKYVIDRFQSAKRAATKLVSAAEDEFYTPHEGLATAESVNAAIEAALGEITGEPMTTAAGKIKDAAAAVTTTPEEVVKAARDALKAFTPDDFKDVEIAHTLDLEAAFPGRWGEITDIRVDRDGITEQLDGVYDGLTHQDLFNLSVSYAPVSGMTISERHINLSVKDDAGARRVDRVLKGDSVLLRIREVAEKPVLPNAKPDDWVFEYAPMDIAGQGDGGEEKDEAYDSEGLGPLDYEGNGKLKTGMHALDNVDIFNLMCIPPDSRDPTLGSWDTDKDLYVAAAVYCTNKRAMLIMDPPGEWTKLKRKGKVADIKMTSLGNFGDTGRNAAVYFPRVVKNDPMLNGQPGVFPACGMVAGIMSATDVKRGVWKAPAGTEASLIGASGLEVRLTDDENGLLNPQGINCLRTFPVIGSVVWGARTARGADQLSDDYKYINVRRLTLYIEESLFRGTQWAVFEPNDQNLWTELKSSADSFMQSLAKQGAFYSYEVVCDASTTSARDINLGIVNMLVAFAPVKPAEFVVIKIQQQTLKD